MIKFIRTAFLITGIMLLANATATDGIQWIDIIFGSMSITLYNALVALPDRFNNIRPLGVDKRDTATNTSEGE